jgi:predicted Zn finger-like uncharacterized protein
MDANLLSPQFIDANKAREYLEEKRWVNGIVCPHCGSTKAYRIEGKTNSKSPARKGLLKCGDCNSNLRYCWYYI